MCSRTQTKNKRETQEGPRESKALKALPTDDVPLAATRARSTSRSKTSPHEEPPNHGATTDYSSTSAAAASAPAATPAHNPTIPYGPDEIAEQRKAATVQNEHLQQQMLDANRQMQIVTDRTAAIRQLP